MLQSILVGRWLVEEWCISARVRMWHGWLQAVQETKV